MAVYEGPGLPPRIRVLEAESREELVRRAVAETLAEVRAVGGHMPEAALREVVANLAHAGFAGATISVLEEGREVAVSDCGPGIADPASALRPGFFAGGSEGESIGRGVGSGLGLAANLLQLTGGRLAIEPNVGGGTVVTLRATASLGERKSRRTSHVEPESGDLTERQKQTLLALADGRERGPSLVAEQVGCSLATAYRDLARLEEMGLVLYVGRGKRVIGPDGLHVVTRLLEGPGWGRGSRP